MKPLPAIGRLGKLLALAAIAAAGALVYAWSMREAPATHEFIIAAEDGFSTEAVRRSLDGARVRVEALKSLQGKLHRVTVTAPGSEAEIARRLAAVPGVAEVEASTEMRVAK